MLTLLIVLCCLAFLLFTEPGNYMLGLVFSLLSLLLLAALWIAGIVGAFLLISWLAA